MPKINHEEYEILKSLDEKWKWIARDYYRNSLWVYVDKPDRSRNEWTVRSYQLEALHEYENLFQSIQWADENPYNIAELIKDYENIGFLNKNLGIWVGLDNLQHADNDTSKLVTEESGEKEVKKDIEWLKSAIQQNIDFYNDNDEEWQMAKVRAYTKSLDLINQLDEPEVLSQEFINEKAVEVYADTADAEVHAVFRMRDLQELLVPKQELPVIPKFVAEAIEEDKECGYDVYESIDLIIGTNGGGLPSISKWVARNIDKYARAYLGGYTVEKEQKYYIYLGDGQYLVSEDELREQYAKIRHEEDIGFSNYVLTFTEQEIKEYDPRYMTFAKPVEEME